MGKGTCGVRVPGIGAWLVSNLPLSSEITRITPAVLFIWVLMAAFALLWMAWASGGTIPTKEKVERSA